MIALHAGITCLTETNVEWQNYSSRQGYKDAFNNLYASSHHTFSSSSKISSSYHKRGGTTIYDTYRWTHRINLSGKDSTGAGRWSYFTILGKGNTTIVISCFRIYAHVYPHPTLVVHSINNAGLWNQKTNQ
jgi:hypothetical protein